VVARDKLRVLRDYRFEDASGVTDFYRGLLRDWALDPAEYFYSGIVLNHVGRCGRGGDVALF